MGGVVGGVVGGVLGLALLAGLIFFCMRRKRKSAAAAELPGNSESGDREGYGGTGHVRGDYKPYMPVASEVPGSTPGSPETGVSELANRQPHYEMDTMREQRHELA